jgi:hypothetical protein
MRVRCFFLHFSVINFLLCSSLGCGKNLTWQEKSYKGPTEFEKVRAKTKKAQQAFERVKQERFDLFMSCLNTI